jgi:hypothetical protein
MTAAVTTRDVLRVLGLVVTSALTAALLSAAFMALATEVP